MTGCDQFNPGPLEEQKDPHFLTGKNRLKALDYRGAVESFEKALEVNPRSASAHFELGVLYDQKIQDYAAAVFHFERYLRLRPDSPYAEPVRQHITACKRELARSVAPVPVTQSLQRDFERLTAENQQLRQQVAQLQAALAARALPSAVPGVPVSQPPAGAPPRASTHDVAAPDPAPAPASAPTPRTHTVQPGDNPYRISRKYGVTMHALLAANPNVEPTRLQVGQRVAIPVP
jgi:LysM repeat protein